MLLLRPHPLFSPEATQEKVWVTKERWIIEKNSPDEVKVVSGSDHMLMFSKPQEMCSCLLEVAKNYF
ncbi:hypothetical protein SADUNF_Sadunf07G0033700 [Salix dunnii]|uniref:Uncharacterized protein n=1 Tax=Salix dunnii TaxID=1413687 RepID=A0A835MYS5_9ROSI|nr:hypothetical protein SADUNF_Sadunf07G0033700 [Salix dunnii]